MKIYRPKFCECNCGQEVKPGRRFIVGHNSKNVSCNKPNSLPPYCGCGCGGFVTWNFERWEWHHFIHGHHRKGKKHKKESRELMKIVQNSPEVRAKHKATSLIPEVHERRSKSKKDYFSKPGAKERNREAQKKAWNNKEIRKRNSKRQKEIWSDPEAKRKQSELLKQIFSDPAIRTKMSIAKVNACKDPKVIDEMSKRMLKVWGNPEFVRKQIKARNVRQNKQEKRLENILEELFPGEWKFVGDGEVIIAGKCPDFVNINGQKKIIELFGDYWHEGSNPQDRIDVFKPFGYDTLVIWEKELVDTKQLAERITEFNRKLHPTKFGGDRL
jgi:hypothetical protein